jgi:hypothetical protein
MPIQGLTRENARETEIARKVPLAAPPFAGRLLRWVLREYLHETRDRTGDVGPFSWARDSTQT